jgi:hypothetical protein
VNIVFTEDYVNNCFRPDPDPPGLYGLPKILKERVPLEPTVRNTVLLPNNSPSTWKDCSIILSGILHTMKKNSMQFIQTLESTRLKPDIVSSITKLQIADSLTRLSHHSEDDILAQFKHVLTST